MSAKTLVLDVGYRPHRVIGWQEAVSLIYKGRAEVVELYDDALRAMSREVARAFQLSKQMLSWFEMGGDGDVFVVRVPAVVRLLGGSVRKKAVKFSRINVMTRDKFRCQYCGDRKPMSQLNYDHVIPRSRGGRTVWENIVTACYDCNSRKANKTLEEAGMRPLVTPVKPKSLPIATLRIDPSDNVPEVWRNWLYWNVELEP